MTPKPARAGQYRGHRSAVVEVVLSVLALIALVATALAGPAHGAPTPPRATSFADTVGQCVPWTGHTFCTSTGSDQATFFGAHATGTAPLTFAIDGCTPSGETDITYTNSPSFITRSTLQAGTVVCTWRVTDSAGASATATYTLTVTPPAKPVATSFSESGPQCVPGPMTFCSSTSMPVDDFFATHVSGAGQLSSTVDSCTPAGETDVTITPGPPAIITRSAGEIATVVCTWHVTDGVGQQSDPATYTLTITVPPGTPTVSDIHETQTINTDVPYDHVLATGALPADGTLTFDIGACTYNGNAFPPSRDVGVTTPRSKDGTVTVSLGASGFTGTIDCLFTATSTTTGKTSAPAHFIVTVPTPTPPTVSDVHKTQTKNTDMTYDSALAEGSGPPGTKLGFDFGPCLFNGAASPPSADVHVSATRGGTVTVMLSGSGYTGTIDCTFTATAVATGATSTPAHFVVTIPAPIPPSLGDVSVVQSYDTTVSYPTVLAGHLTNPAGGAVTFALGTCSRAGVVTLTDAAAGDIRVALTGTHFVGSITCPFSVVDANGQTAHAQFRVTTTHVPTRTALASSRNPSIVGDPVTLTATVTATAGPHPTGTVTFLDGATVLGTTSLNAGAVATLTTTNLAGGTHHLTARYNGDATDDASTSTAMDEVVIACAANLDAHVLSVATTAGTLHGLFCINRLLTTGTYTQLPFDGLPKLVGAAVVTITPQKVVLVANSLAVQLTALKSPTVNSFVETFPRAITGTFSLT